MKSFAFIALLIVLSECDLLAQAQNVFVGRPSLKISEGGIERTPERVTPKDAPNLRCIICRIGDEYYWASRENKILVRIEDGAFITYVSPGGAGYIRVIKPDTKDLASLMSESEKAFDYVEHMLIGLRSVTYYGQQEE